MASTNPTISGNTLSVHGTHTDWGEPQLRMSTSSLPGVKGVFVQRNPNGAPVCSGRGVLKSTTEASLNSAIRTIQNDIGHEQATYTDGDGSTHDNCILVRYFKVGDIKKQSDSVWWCDVRFSVLKMQAD
jgi:hypothetical protein